MEKAVWIISFKLKKGTTKEEFIEATESLHNNVLSKANGFIMWEQYLDEDVWTDFVTWQSLEDANEGIKVGHGTKEAKKFYSYIQMNTCKMLVSTLVKKYERPL